MGAEGSFFGDYMIFRKENPQHVGKINHQEIKYHASWDWLIPVIAKCEDIYRTTVGVGEYQAGIGIKFRATQSQLLELNMGGVYLSIVEFIEWHNQQAPRNAIVADTPQRSEE